MTKLSKNQTKHLLFLSILSISNICSASGDEIKDPIAHGEQAHKNHIKVFVDDDEDNPNKWQQEWQTLIDMSVDGIQTDQPEALISFIKSVN